MNLECEFFFMEFHELILIEDLILFILFQILQVDLEPHGKIHVIVELKWHGKLSMRLINVDFTKTNRLIRLSLNFNFSRNDNVHVRFSVVVGT